MEDDNIYGINHLDADVRLPPRKRLLAGLKRQSSDCASPPSPLSSLSTDFNTRLRNLLNSNSKNLGLSPEEIIETSRSAALAAAKVAAAAKAAAEEKAAVAVKAAAAAKSALELVASVSAKAACKERCPSKNKPKKHVPVKLFYKKRKTDENCETDEELARRLHRAMNSSPRISKNSVSSDRKIHNNNNHKIQLSLEKPKFSDRGSMSEGNLPSLCERNVWAGEVDCGGSILEVENIDKVGEKGLESTIVDCSKMDTFPSGVEAETSSARKKHWRALEDVGTTSRKRGRIKQKKLSLSLCTFRDRENLKEDSKFRGFLSTGESKDYSVSRDMPFFDVNLPSEGEASIKAMSIWKHNEFKTPLCFPQSKIMQSLCSNPTVTRGSAMIEVDQ